MSSVSQTEGYPEDWGAGVYIDESTRDAILQRPSQQFDWEDILPESEEPAGAVAVQERPKAHQTRKTFFRVGSVALAAGVGAGYATVRIRSRRR